MNIIDAMDDKNLFGEWFRQPETWTAWRVFIKALFGLPMTESDLSVFRQCTGRERPKPDGYAEAWLICGRRSGKSFVLALIGTYLAAFHDQRRYLQPGERAVVMTLAERKDQAELIFSYADALFKEVPLLQPMVLSRTADTLVLDNASRIEVTAASFRGARGRTAAAVLCDELAFWRDESSANPDIEILNAVRPSLATIPGAKLICASSPYARRGALWQAHKDHWGQNDSAVLVWQAGTLVMNPTVSEAFIAAAYERDAASAAAEYGAQFRTDVETFVSREALEAVVAQDCRERAPADGVAYVAFVDPSGGRADSMTLAIAHRDGDRAVLDAIREVRPPFSPEAVVAEFAMLLKAYRLGSVQGDRYAGEWPRERFAVHGIDYKPADAPKSDIYRDFLPLVNAGLVELLDSDRLLAQLTGLERRTARGGRDSIDHAPRAHDDLANAVAGALVLAGKPAPKPFEWYVSPPDPLGPMRDLWQELG